MYSRNGGELASVATVGIQQRVIGIDSTCLKEDVK